jgi:hypothetical protein
MTPPLKALSIRQPWAHAVAMGWKPVENRDWRKPNPGLNFRGRVAIHASSGMTQDEYNSARATFAAAGCECPPAHELVRGAIIGAATVVDIVKEHDSPWFFGPRALVLADAEMLPEPIPCDGALGFFSWTRADRGLIQSKPWMLKYGAAAEPQTKPGLLL